MKNCDGLRVVRRLTENMPPSDQVDCGLFRGQRSQLKGLIGVDG